MAAPEPLLRKVASLSLFWRSLFAFAAGSLTVLAFAPFSFHFLAIAGSFLLTLLWLNASPAQAFREGWLFGFGLMGVGVFWMQLTTC